MEKRSCQLILVVVKSLDPSVVELAYHSVDGELNEQKSKPIELFPPVVDKIILVLILDHGFFDPTQRASNLCFENEKTCCYDVPVKRNDLDREPKIESDKVNGL